MSLSKPRDALFFLASVESMNIPLAQAYSDCISKIIEHVVTLDAARIESEFLSVNLTQRQDREIEQILELQRPDLQIVRDF